MNDLSIVKDEFLVNTQTASFQSDPSITSLSNGGFVVTWEDRSGTLGDSSYSSIKAKIFSAAGNLVQDEFLVNTQTDGYQYVAPITSLSNGGFVVTWYDYSGTLGDDSVSSVKAKIFSATGGLVQDEFLVNTQTDGSQYTPSITGLSNGGFVVTWEDGSGTLGDSSGTSVKAKIFNAAGGLVQDEFLVNTQTDGYQYAPSITSLSNGGFVITWYDGSGTLGDSSDYSVKAKIFNAAGNLVQDEFLVNTQTDGYQYAPSITSLSNGGFVVTWEDRSGTLGDSSGYSVKAKIFNAAGGLVQDEFLVNTQTDGYQYAPSITSLSNGGFVITWQDNSGTLGDSSDYSVKAKIFNAAGNLVQDEFLVNTQTDGRQSTSSITSLSNGGFVVTWQDNSGTLGDSSDYSVKAKVYNYEGELFSEEARVSELSDGSDFATYSRDGVVSKDGNYVVFGSHAPFADDTTGQIDDDDGVPLWLANRATGEIVAFSTQLPNVQQLFADFAQFMSDDELYYLSKTLDGQLTLELVANDPGDGAVLLSENAQLGSEISDNGHIAAWVEGDNLRAYNTQTGTFSTLSNVNDGNFTSDYRDLEFANPSVSGDGSKVALSLHGTGNNDDAIVRFLRVVDLDTNSVTDFQIGGADLIGPDLTERSIHSANLSKNGQYLAFATYSPLVEADTDGSSDVYVIDLNANAIALVSIATDGNVGNGDSYYPAMSDDGNTIVFTSSASNLDDSDDNSRDDVFVKEGPFDFKPFPPNTPENQTPTIVSTRPTEGSYEQSAALSGLNVSDWFADADGDTLAYTVTSGSTLPEGLSLDANTGAITGNISAAVGNHDVSITATDPDGATASGSYRFVVEAAIPENQTPTIVSTRPTEGSYEQSAALSGLNVSDWFADADGDTLTYSVTSGSTLPEGLSLDANTGAITGNISAAVGNHDVSITATDPDGAAASGSYRFVVETAIPENQTPTIVSTRPTEGSYEQSTALSGLNVSDWFADADGDTLTYSVTSGSTLPEGLSLDANTGAITGNISAAVGNHDVSITATDPDGAAASGSYRFVVEAALSPIIETENLILTAEKNWSEEDGGFEVSNTKVVIGYKTADEEQLRLEKANVRVEGATITATGLITALTNDGNYDLFEGQVAINAQTGLGEIKEITKQSGDAIVHGLIDISYESGEQFHIGSNDIEFESDLVSLGIFEFEPAATFFNNDGRTIGLSDFGTSFLDQTFDFSTDLFNWDVELKDMSVVFNAIEDALYIKGSASIDLEDVFSGYLANLGLKQSLKLNVANDNFIRLSALDGELNWDVVGDLTLSDKSKDAFIQQLTLSLDTVQKSAGADVNLSLPLFDVGAGLGFKYDPFILDSANISLDGLYVPLGPSGLALSGGALSASNISQVFENDSGAWSDVSWGGQVDFRIATPKTAPPIAEGNINGQLGNDNYQVGFDMSIKPEMLLTETATATFSEGDLAKKLSKYFNIDVSEALNTKLFTANGTLEAKKVNSLDLEIGDYEITGPVRPLNQDPNFWYSTHYQATVNVDLLSVFSASGKLEFSQFQENTQFGAELSGSLSLPKSHILGSNKTLEANAKLSFTDNNDLSDDYMALWAAYNIPFWGEAELGFSVGFDMDFNILGSDEIELIASWDLDPTNEVVLLTANWENEYADGQLVVITPEGQRITEAEFGDYDYIELADDLNSVYQRSVALNRPYTGRWDIEMVQAAELLGEITYQARELVNAPQIESIDVDVNDTTHMAEITIDLDMVKEGLKIDVYVRETDSDERALISTLSTMEDVTNYSTTWDFSENVSGEYVVEVETNHPDYVSDKLIADEVIEVDYLNQTVEGTADGNEITTVQGNDIIQAMAGDDIVNTGRGNDHTIDGLGNDTVNAGGGDDLIQDFSGINFAAGGSGSDFIMGGIQNDSLEGGAGNDLLRGDASTLLGGSDVIDGGTGDDLLMGGKGADTFVFKSDDGDDTIAAFNVGDVGYGALTGYTVTPSAKDFHAEIDKVKLVGFSNVDQSNVMASVTDGTNGAVFATEGTSITFYGVAADEITEDVFVFV